MIAMIIKFIFMVPTDRWRRGTRRCRLEGKVSQSEKTTLALPKEGELHPRQREWIAWEREDLRYSGLCKKYGVVGFQ